MPEFTYTNIHKETPIGAGFYALRHNTSKAGVYYSRLVKADRSPSPRFFVEKRTPLVGKRTRIKHRARTCARLNRGE